MYQLQILHASDLEGGPRSLFGNEITNLAAIIDILEDQVPNSITLSTGDNFIPGPFYFVGDDAELQAPLQEVYETFFGLEAGSLDNLEQDTGRIDISIMNIIGFDASGVGNHEFDRGTEAYADIISTDIEGDTLSEVRWLGAQFPYLSANLDFSGDESLSSLATTDILPNTAFQSLPDNLTEANNTPKLAPATIITEGEEQIGIVGVTTPFLPSLSSIGDVEVTGSGDNEASAIAASIQPTIDELLDQGINKIVVVAHLQQLSLEQEVISLLEGVDILVAGSSDTLLADDNDFLRAGDTPEGNYPLVTTNADGDPALIVSTDSQYSYVGRLVVEFDDNGILDPSSVDPTVSGSFATTNEVTNLLWDDEDPFAEGSKGGLVQQLTDAVEDIIIPRDADILGQTAVFLEGEREQLRTEETNLGNLTADAILSASQAIDDSVAVAIKNAGGIRASIGQIDPNTGEKLLPQANPRSGKAEGEISQLDIENAISFNDPLVLFTVTAEELKTLIEHGVSESAPGDTPGQFPQVGGLRFSFDVQDDQGAFISEGERVQSLVLVDNQGQTTDIVVQDGEIVGDPNRLIRVVTLEFLADGGDGYPFSELGDNRVDTGLTEQGAVAQYLQSNFAETPFNLAETEAEADTRIQNLDLQDDSILGSPITSSLRFGSLHDDTFDIEVTPNFDGDNDIVFTGAENDEVIASEAVGSNRIYGGTGNDELVAGTDDRLFGSLGDDILDSSEGGGNNRLYGGQGNDLFVLSSNDRAWGGDGNDQFFITNGGNNLIYGGVGIDRFQLVSSEFPFSSNTVGDLEANDIIGIGGLGDAPNLSFGQDEAGNATLQVEGQLIATFLGVTSEALETANFDFS